MKKCYYHNTAAGEHFPDATVGDVELYGLSLNCYTRGIHTVIASKWSVASDGLEVIDSDYGVDSTSVKVKVLRVGTFSLSCAVELDNDTTKVITMMVRVYA